LDVSGTGITPASLLGSLSLACYCTSACGHPDARENRKIFLQYLVVPGQELDEEEDEGESDSCARVERSLLSPPWEDLAECVDVTRLREFWCGNRRLTVGCGNVTTGG
jgi:hypothetical protein